MSTINYKKLFLLSVLAFALSPVFGQDSLHTSFIKKSGDYIYNLFKKEEYGKNIIRYNPVPTILFEETRNAAIGYERVLGHNQSISANAGYFFLPQFIGSNIGAVDVDHKTNNGYILSLDYRFYLKKLNTRPAPNGIYIGPFYSVYHHSGQTDFNYTAPDANGIVSDYHASLKTSFTLNNIGFQLGYQFIFFKRVSLDMILFGPAVSFYNIDINVESNLSSDQKQKLYEKYYDQFFSKYPIFQELFSFGTFNKKGSSTGILPNFRYMFQVGYHF